MRLVGLLPAPLLLTLTSALQLPNLQPYLPAVYFPISISDYIPPTTSTNAPHPEQQPHDLLKRQFSNTCPKNFASCDNVGAPGLCCVKNAACVADDAGNVACCEAGAVCTGIVNGVITSGTVDQNGNLVSSAGGGAAGGGQVVTSVGSSYIQTASGGANGGLVAASSPATIAPFGSSSGGNFIVNGQSTVATPGAGVRGAEVPLIAKVIIRILEMVPL